MGKDFKELLNEFNAAVKALDLGFKPEDWARRGSVYMHRLDRAEDLRIALLECGTLSGVEGEQFAELCRKLEVAEDKLQDILQNKEGKGMNTIEKIKNNQNWIEFEDVENLFNLFTTNTEEFKKLMEQIDAHLGEDLREQFEGNWGFKGEIVEWYKHFKFMQAVYSYIYPWENSENGIDLAQNYSYYRGE